MRILKIVGDELVVQVTSPAQGFSSLRDDLLYLVRLPDFHGNDSSARGIEVRAEIEHLALIADEAVVRIKLVEQLHHIGVSGLKIPVIHPVAPIGALPDGNDEIAVILRHRCAIAPFRVVRIVIYQLVR